MTETPLLLLLFLVSLKGGDALPFFVLCLLFLLLLLLLLLFFFFFFFSFCFFVFFLFIFSFVSLIPISMFALIIRLFIGCLFFVCKEVKLDAADLQDVVMYEFFNHTSYTQSRNLEYVGKITQQLRSVEVTKKIAHKI